MITPEQRAIVMYEMLQSEVYPTVIDMRTFIEIYLGCHTEPEDEASCKWCGNKDIRLFCMTCENIQPQQEDK